MKTHTCVVVFLLGCMFFLYPAWSHAQDGDDVRSAMARATFFRGLKSQGKCLTQIQLYEAQTVRIETESQKLRTTTGEEKTRVVGNINRMGTERDKTYEDILECAAGTAKTAAPPGESRLTGLESPESFIRRYARARDNLIEAHRDLIKAYEDLMAHVKDAQPSLGEVTKPTLEESLNFIIRAGQGDYSELLKKAAASGNR